MRVTPVRFAIAATSLVLLSACGGGSQEDAESVRNDTARQEALIANQAKALQAEAENGTRVIEQALENETANVFENREALLNQSAGDTAPADNAAR